MSTCGTQPGASVLEMADLANLRALFALRGHSLHQSGSGFYVERWGLTREMATLADVRAFLAQIGGRE